MKNRAKTIRVSLTGVNLNRVYSECKKQNIDLYNIDRIDYKNIEFDIDIKNKSILKGIAKGQRYEYKEKNNYGAVKFINFLKYRFGILIGIVFFVLINIISSFFVWNIQIIGNETVSKDDILGILESQKISVGKPIRSLNLENIENEITNNIEEISLCSVIKKGTTIIVNVKEKISNGYQSDTNSCDIVAPENLTIVELNVVNGTAQKKVGDSVKKGEVIVGGFLMDSNGNKISCNAVANIKAKLWRTETFEYYKQKEVATRTGKVIKIANLDLFDMEFPVKKGNNVFENFEVEENTYFLTDDNFLPLIMTEKIYYEVEKSVVTQNFEADRKDIISNLQRQANMQVKENEVVVKTFETITEDAEKFIITAYVEVEFDI